MKFLITGRNKKTNEKRNEDKRKQRKEIQVANQVSVKRVDSSLFVDSMYSIDDLRMLV